MNDFRYYRPDAFPPVVKNLIIINALIFVAQFILHSNNSYVIETNFALFDVHSVFFKPWQLFTYMFLHGGIDHIFFNMFALWMFGRTLENVWGAKRFLIFYIVCGLGAGLMQLGVLYLESHHTAAIVDFLSQEQQEDYYSKINSPTLGASGAIFGCLAAFGYLFPNSEIYLYFLFPLKAKWFVLIYAGLELWLGVRNSAGDSVAHFAHLGGAIIGFILVFIWNKTNKRTLY